MYIKSVLNDFFINVKFHKHETVSFVKTFFYKMLFNGVRSEFNLHKYKLVLTHIGERSVDTDIRIGTLTLSITFYRK